MKSLILLSAIVIGLSCSTAFAQTTVDTAQKIIPLRRATAKKPSRTLLHVANQNEKKVFNNQVGTLLFKSGESQNIIVDLDGNGVISDGETSNGIHPRTTFTVKTLQGDYKLQQIRSGTYVMFFSMTRLVSKENPYQLKVTVADQNGDGRFDDNDLIKIGRTAFNGKGNIIPVLGYPSRVTLTPDCSALVITPVVGDYVNVFGELKDSNWTANFYFYPSIPDTMFATGIASSGEPAVLNANRSYMYQMSAVHQKDSRIKLYIRGEEPKGWQEKVSKMVVKLNLTLEPTFVVEPEKDNCLKLVKCDVRNDSQEVHLQGILPSIYLRQKGIERLISKVSYG